MRWSVLRRPPGTDDPSLARRRVLLLANNFPPVRGGSASVYANLARCAAGRVVVMAPWIDYTDGLPLIGWREHDRTAPYPVLRLPLLRTTVGARVPKGLGKLSWVAWDATIRLRLTLALLVLVLRDGVRTVCVGELLASHWILRLLRILPGVRAVAYVHGEEITTDDAYNSGHARARRALLDSDRVVVVSRFTRDAVAALVGAGPAGRVALIQNGVDTGLFQRRPKSAALLRHYGLDGCFVFVSVSRLVEKKGTDAAIRAFARVVARHPECRLLVVGTGPYRPVLDRVAAEAGVTAQVVFTGAVAEDELVEHYQLGDVFVMPNRRMPDGDTEGFGLVFLEANGCGLPAIAGQDGGSTEAVEDGVNGLVVDGASVDAVAAAMLALREDAELYASLQRQGLERAAASDWREKTRAFLDVCGVGT